MLLEKRLPLKYLFKIIMPELVIVFVVGVVTRIGANLYYALPSMPLAIPAFLGTSISVLLSFKMNQSYERWWEARRLWGVIANESRSFILQLKSFMIGEQTAALKRIGFRQIAWVYILGRSLRNLDQMPQMSKLLSAYEQAEMLAKRNRPLFLLQQTCSDLSCLQLSGALDTHTHINLQETIGRLNDSMGGAERINSTVFPSTYRWVLHFIIYLFVVTLTISLNDIDGRLVAPLLLLIAGGFFLIEKVAYHLQDPFRNRPSDVPMTNISNKIEKDIRELLDEPMLSEVADNENPTYYVM